MKKICFAAFDLSVIGGVEQVTASLANALCDRYEVYIYSINLNEGEKKYELDERIHFRGQLRGEVRLRHMITKSFRPFIRYVRENQIDVVFMMENYAALVTSWTRPFVRAKYVYCDHGALMNQWHRKDIVAIKFWDSLTADRVVTLTRRTRNDFIRKFHVPKKKIRYIYNWIEPKVLKARQPYRTESRKIISVGRFGAEKGYDLLVKAAKRAMPSHPDWTWDIYGEGVTFPEIRESLRREGLDGQVILKGGVKDAYLRFPEYAFLVLPSYREGLPLVLLEAKGIGLPMVSFDIITGPREIIRDGKDGILIPPYDTDQMAEKLCELMDHPERREEMARRTCEGLGRFRKESILKQWEELIDSL